ncbi:MAG: hypothetical protein RR425_00940 [Erysipelotrichales bacterium]
MNSITKKYILKCFVLPILLFLLISLFSLGSTSIASYNILLSIINPLLVLYFYFYLIDDKSYNYQMQLPIKRFTRLTSPLIAIFSFNLVFDIVSIIFFKEEFILGNSIFKYLNASLMLLIIITSDSYPKIIGASLLTLIAFDSNTNLVFNQFLHMSQINAFNIILILLINIVPLLIIYYLYRVRYFIHDRRTIKRYYYGLIIVYVILFFLKLFISKYPYVNNLFTIKILGYNVAIYLYLLVLVGIIIRVFYKEQRINIKKILKLYLPIILISMIYITGDKISEVSNVNCRYISKIQNAGDDENTINMKLLLSHQSLNFDVGQDNAQRLGLQLGEQAEACYFNSRITETDNSLKYDFNGLKTNQQQLLSFGNMTYLFNNRKTLLSDVIELSNSIDNIHYFSIINKNTEYRLVYVQDSLKDTKNIKEKISKVNKSQNDIEVIFVDDKKGKYLYNELFYDLDNYDDVEISNEIFFSTYSITQDRLVQDRIEGYTDSKTMQRLNSYFKEAK